MRTNFLMALVPMVSVVFSIIFINSWLAGPVAGFVYFLYTPIMFTHGKRSEKKRIALIEELKQKEIAACVNVKDSKFFESGFVVNPVTA